MKKVISMILAATVIAVILCGCGKVTPAVTFRDTVISENEYCYYISSYKGKFLQGIGATSDNAAYWTNEISEGVTVGDYVGLLATNDVMSCAVQIGLFDEYGLELTTAEINDVDKTINSYASAVGGKTALNSILSAYGINADMLRNIKLNEVKMNKVQVHMYSDKDIVNLTEADVEEYFKGNYQRVKYIFISSKKEYVRDEDGSLLKNEDGSYKTRDITDKEKAEKEALAKDIDLRITAGEDFEKLLNEYTMDVGMLHFADGYYYTSSSSYVEQSLRTALAEAEIGEIVNIETDSGWYIAKRYELEDGAWKKEENAAMFTTLSTTVIALKMQEYIASFASEVTIDEEIVKAYPLAFCTANFNY